MSCPLFYPPPPVPPRCPIFAHAIRNAVILAALTCCWLGLSSKAYACASCACGDPTLTVMGSEQPFAGRLRLALLGQYRNEYRGDPNRDETHLDDKRVALAFSYAFSPRWSVGAQLPLSARRYTQSNGAAQSSLGVGDLELWLRAYVFEGSSAWARHLISVQAGLQMDTGKTLRDAEGNIVTAEIQPGSGGFIPSVAFAYAAFWQPWSFSAITSLRWPISSRFDSRPGLTSLTSLVAQWQPWWFLGLQAGLDARWAAADVQRDGSNDAHSGGGILFARAGVVGSPWQDLLLSLTVRQPIANMLRGSQRQTLGIETSIAYDF